jgi:hypothetical protein
MIVKKLHDAGLTSVIASWVVSLKAEARGIGRADRWGIFIGEWAPTFFALGIALSRYEVNDDLGEEAAALAPPDAVHDQG